jgi:hypothetical protein
MRGIRSIGHHQLLRACLFACAFILSVFFVDARADDLLAGITIAEELDGSDYDRSRHFGGWLRDDDGIDVRQHVLAAESYVPVTWDEAGRKVIAGLWFDPFTGRTFRSPFSASGYAVVQIDHVVPLKEAWESGAKNWSQDERIAYANDLTNPGHLIAVHGPTNGSKGHRDPAEWVVPNADFQCAYALTWVAIKRHWNLTMDDDEAQAIRTIGRICN